MLFHLFRVPWIGLAAAVAGFRHQGLNLPKILLGSALEVEGERE